MTSPASLPLSVTSDGFLLKTEQYPYALVDVKTTERVIIHKPDEVRFTWTGGKIRLPVWQQILSFFLWSQEKHKSESLVQLFYNPDTQQWAVWAFPQRGIGMTVKHMEEDARYATDRAQFPEPWVSFGSVHHHCTSKAFASGTDTQDELKKEGLHITIGELDKPVFDIHSRVSFKGMIYPAALPDWFDLGDSQMLGNLNDIGETFTRWALTSRGIIQVAHPAAWEERFCNTAAQTWHPDRDNQGGHLPGFQNPSVTGASHSTDHGKVTEETRFINIACVELGDEMVAKNLEVLIALRNALHERKLKNLNCRKALDEALFATLTDLMGSPPDPDSFKAAAHTCFRLGISIEDVIHVREAVRSAGGTFMQASFLLRELQSLQW